MRLQPRLCLTLLHDTRPFGSCCSEERPHLSGGCLPRQNVKCHTLNVHFSVIAFVKKKKLKCGAPLLTHHGAEDWDCTGHQHWSVPVLWLLQLRLSSVTMLCTKKPEGWVYGNKPSPPKISSGKDRQLKVLFFFNEGIKIWLQLLLSGSKITIKRVTHGGPS